MKFSAKITDQGSAETFSKVVHTAAKLSKKCVLRIGVDKMCFVQNETHKDHAHALWIEIVANHIFQDFRLDGLSPEANEVVLEIAPDEVARVLRPAVLAKQIRIKLTKKDNTPHMTFEIKPQARSFFLFFLA
uniref:Proliferating cell nuclear antigen PCNA N-terminal domain-containing protein n=1 Tax=Plectus sambesii TaxID=2011161 RepID=A0A914XLR1_9BILA